MAIPAVALSQSQIDLLLERCCMGVVSQIEDLDNSSTKRESDVSVPICGIPTVAKSLPRNDSENANCINQRLLRS